MSKKIHLDDHDHEFIRGVYRLITLCPRAVAELLLEISCEFLLRGPIDAKLAYYLDHLEAIRPEVLAALGISELPRGRRRRPRRDRIPAAARQKRAPARPWRPVPIKRSERRPTR